MTAAPLRVFCLLPTLNPYGGVVSVVSAMNVLIARGHQVTMASLSQHSDALVAPLTEPTYLDDPELIGQVAREGVDIALATSWHTVEPIAALAQSRSEIVPWYFVQDFEPDFYKGPERLRALQTYDMITRRVAKTEYLRGKLAAHGWASEKIQPGMNLEIFYPRDVDRSPNRVLAMARPSPAGRVDNRGFETLRRTFQRISAERPDTELIVFGTNAEIDWDFRVTSVGLKKPSELPELYSSAAVFVDTSPFHGFGRSGIEAMACGTPVVLTASGGIAEYARPDQNALIVPTNDPNVITAAILNVLDNRALGHQLSQEGLSTASRLDDRIAADQLIALFESSLGR